LLIIPNVKNHHDIVIKYPIICGLGLVTALLLALNLTAHAGPCCSKLNQAESESVWIVGHRGAAGLKPENTLSAFARALELGVDAIISNRPDRLRRLLTE